MKPSFEKTTGVLIKAYLQGTLMHGTCAACAVGNLVAHALEIPVVNTRKGIADKPSVWDFRWESGEYYPLWQLVFCTRDYERKQERQPYNYEGVTKEQIDATGYTWKQLARIEKAFELASQKGDFEYNGLVAVFEVLASIHQVDLSTKQTALEALSAPSQ